MKEIFQRQVYILEIYLSNASKNSEYSLWGTFKDSRSPIRSIAKKKKISPSSFFHACLPGSYVTHQLGTLHRTQCFAFADIKYMQNDQWNNFSRQKCLAGCQFLFLRPFLIFTVSSLHIENLYCSPQLYITYHHEIQLNDFVFMIKMP